MLRDWLAGNSNTATTSSSGSDAARPATEAKGGKTTSATSGGAKGQAAGRKDDFDDDPVLARELTEEEAQREKQAAVRKKLREAATEQPHHQQSVTYDSLYRVVNRLLMEGHSSSGMELHDGVQLSVSKQFQNAQLQSKWTFGDPQQANWESVISMNGFTDMMSATYSTLGRCQLMYQRMFKSGGLLVTQYMMQPTPMGNHGTFFGLWQYPWVRHGCSTFTYLKGQHVSATHCSRLIRGVHVGANLTYDLNTHGTSMSYAASTVSVDKSTHWGVEVKPSSGEWKLGVAKTQWAQDIEVGAQLEVKEGRQGKSSGIVIGLRKPLIGGGSIHSVLSNFKKLKMVLELPFGLDRSRVNVQYCVQFDATTGGAKHGLTLSM